jgi:D-alanyl-lipoteichoic acid acyltransferase DltB (MBOAT superfamily)
MNDAIENFWKAIAGGGDERWRLLPTIVIVVLIAVLWHWLHWYAAILIAVGVGIIAQAIGVAVKKRGTDSAESTTESESQENL